MADREPLSIGTVLRGRYRLEQVLGQGTFWLTYLARDKQRKEQVVVKEYLPLETAARGEDGRIEARLNALDATFAAGRSRVLDEADRMSGLEHPAIAAIKTTFEENGTAYVVREYIKGQSFLNWASAHARRRSQTEMDRVCGALLDALEYAHAKGILHLDITPEHVLMRVSDGAPVLIDFGAARSALACSTRAMHSFIRPGYSPPEQHVFDEAAQGPWTDVFALSAVFYRAIMGRAPLDVIARNQKDDMAKAMAIPEGIYRAHFLRAIDKAMALDPRPRQQSIAILRAELFKTAENTESSAKQRRPAKAETGRAENMSPPPGTARATTRRWLIALLPLLVVVGGIGVILGSWNVRDTIKNPRQVIDRKPGPAEIALITEPAVLLKMADADPAMRNPVARRLEALGYLRISGASTETWRKPGAGEPFRDCPACPEMVVVPAGSFLMGSPLTEEGRGDDEDDTAGPGGERVTATLPRPFALGRYTVTRAEFAEFVSVSGYKVETGCHARYGSWQLVADFSWQHPGFEQDGRHPVVCVSWDDAQAYAAWLSRTTGQDYRLPTEMEWEYAARGSTRADGQSRYFFGDDESELCRYANIADLDAKSANPGWSVVNCHDGYTHTAPVGQFKPNGFGLYDMHGNVWGWTSDCMVGNLVRSEGKPVACPASDLKVLRGGSWRDNGPMVRAAARIASAPGVRDEIAGFRLVRTLSK